MRTHHARVPPWTSALPRRRAACLAALVALSLACARGSVVGDSHDASPPTAQDALDAPSFQDAERPVKGDGALADATAREASAPDVADAPPLDGWRDVTAPDVPSIDVTAPDTSVSDAPVMTDRVDVVTACDAGLMRCAEGCVNTLSDTAHCGECGTRCEAGFACAAGLCVNPATAWTTTAFKRTCPSAGAGMRFAYACPSITGTAPGSVWGTDTYTNDSSVCTAGVHAGRVTTLRGGSVTIEMRPGQSSYLGSSRNGVTSLSYGAWGCSFVFP